MNKTDQILKEIYGESDLGAHPFFSGDFINFGLWKGIDLSKPISKSDRVLASCQLYDLLFESMQIDKSDTVCEIGFGHGMGLLRANEVYKVQELYGIDLQPEQVERALNIIRSNPDSSKFHLSEGSAEKTGLSDGSLTKLFSVEAAHHFPSIPRFLNEALRVLKPGGRIGVTTLFPKTAESLARLPKEVPDLDLELHPMIPMDAIGKHIEDSGLELLSCEGIGDNVFHGFDNWVQQTGLQESWGPIWLQAFEKGLIDYYLFVAQK